MKIKKPDVQRIKCAIDSVINKHGWSVIKDNYENGNFKNSQYVKNLNTRLQWDLFWASGFEIQSLPDHKNISDAHIETALRRIVPKIERKY